MKAPRAPITSRIIAIAWAADRHDALTSSRLRPIRGPNAQIATSRVSSSAMGGGAGVPHHPPDHRAETDGEHGVADLPSCALGEDIGDLLQRNAPDEADTHGDEQQGGEAVESQLRHQEEQDQHADRYDKWHGSVPL